MPEEAAGETPALSIAVRDADGKFVKGYSGNPAGRQPNEPGKQKLTQLKNRLEIAVRESMSPDKIHRIVSKMCDMAAEGNVRAAKLILDKVISNASVDEDEKAGDGPRKVVFQIENATFAAIQKNAEPATTGEVIDVEATPVTPQEESNSNGS